MGIATKGQKIIGMAHNGKLIDGIAKSGKQIFKPYNPYWDQDLFGQDKIFTYQYSYYDDNGDLISYCIGTDNMLYVIKNLTEKLFTNNIPDMMKNKDNSVTTGQISAMAVQTSGSASMDEVVLGDDQGNMMYLYPGASSLGDLLTNFYVGHRVNDIEIMPKSQNMYVSIDNDVKAPGASLPYNFYIYEDWTMAKNIYDYGVDSPVIDIMKSKNDDVFVFTKNACLESWDNSSHQMTRFYNISGNSKIGLHSVYNEIEELFYISYTNGGDGSKSNVLAIDNQGTEKWTFDVSTLKIDSQVGNYVFPYAITFDTNNRIFVACINDTSSASAIIKLKGDGTLINLRYNYVTSAVWSDNNAVYTYGMAGLMRFSLNLDYPSNHPLKDHFK